MPTPSRLTVRTCRSTGKPRMVDSRMASPKQAAEARRHAARVHRSLADDIRRLREDAGATRRQLAAEAGIDDAYVGRIEDGSERPSLDTYAKLALALGSDLSARLYPNTGPAIRDRHQARITEALIGILHARWKPYPEVGVRRPSRGWVDLVLHDARATTHRRDRDPVGPATARAAPSMVPREGRVAALVGRLVTPWSGRDDLAGADRSVDQGHPADRA